MGFLFGKIFRFVLIIYVGVLAFHLVKPFPEKLAYTGSQVELDPSALTFFSDVTSTATSGARRLDQTIFSEMIKMITRADQIIVADMFLLNQFQGPEHEIITDLSKDFIDALIDKKTKKTDISITLITDPINTGYGGIRNFDLERATQAGIVIVETPLSLLPDSNPLWGGIYHIFFGWFGNSSEHGWLPNPLDAEGEKVSLRTYAQFLNFKANHRKILVTDEVSGGSRSLLTLLTSLDPHTASSANGNIAVKIRSKTFGTQVVSGENLLLSTKEIVPVVVPEDLAEDKKGSAQVTYLTEATLRKEIITILDLLEADDKLDLSLLYLSDRKILRSLERAMNKGATVRILLDPNQSTFGRSHHGIPNRQVAKRLFEGGKKNLTIRWCNTHGEQCQAKLLIAHTGEKSYIIIGSANYTRRDLGKYNLESGVLIQSEQTLPVLTHAQLYFDRVWSNQKGETSVPYETYSEYSILKRALSVIMEYTGLSIF